MLIQLNAKEKKFIILNLIRLGIAILPISIAIIIKSEYFNDRVVVHNFFLILPLVSILAIFFKLGAQYTFLHARYENGYLKVPKPFWVSAILLFVSLPLILFFFSDTKLAVYILAGSICGILGLMGEIARKNQKMAFFFLSKQPTIYICSVVLVTVISEQDIFIIAACYFLFVFHLFYSHLRPEDFHSRRTDVKLLLNWINSLALVALSWKETLILVLLGANAEAIALVAFYTRFKNPSQFVLITNNSELMGQFERNKNLLLEPENSDYRKKYYTANQSLVLANFLVVFTIACSIGFWKDSQYVPLIIILLLVYGLPVLFGNQKTWLNCFKYERTIFYSSVGELVLFLGVFGVLYTFDVDILVSVISATSFAAMTNSLYLNRFIQQVNGLWKN